MFDSNIFNKAKNPVTWIELRSILQKKPELIQMVEPETGATLVHWASITDLGALLDCLNLGAPLNQADARQRKPIDWATETILFLSEDPPENWGSELLYRRLNVLTDNISVLLDRKSQTTHPTESQPGGYSLSEAAIKSMHAPLVEIFLNRIPQSSLPDAHARKLIFFTLGLQRHGLEKSKLVWELLKKFNMIDWSGKISQRSSILHDLSDAFNQSQINGQIFKLLIEAGMPEEVFPDLLFWELFDHDKQQSLREEIGEDVLSSYWDNQA